MPNDYYNYENVVRIIDEVYSESESACNAINDAGLTPEQFFQTASKNVVDTGIKYSVNGDGAVDNVFNNMSTNLSDGNVAQSAINSNAQTGTAAQSSNVRYATESTVNQSGKVEMSAGVTKYKTGQLAPITGYKAVLGSVVSGVAACAAGLAGGKKLASFVYNLNPTFFDSLGLSTLNPATWSSITSDMSDTGFEGAYKTAFNFLFGVEPDGTTQAYMDADALNYLTYALAQKGFFDAGGEAEATVPSGYVMRTDCPTSFPILTGGVIEAHLPNYHRDFKFYIPSGCMAVVAVNDPTSGSGGFNIYLYSHTSGAVMNIEVYDNGVLVGTDSSTVDNLKTSPGGTPYYRTSRGYGLVANDGHSYSFYSMKGSYANSADLYNYDLPAALIDGTVTQQQAMEGVSDQPNATVLSGIDSSSTQQQVADAISQQLADLYNNRIEQSVVQPDGTVKQKIYYPVPIPTNTTNTTTTEVKTITIDQPIRIILPDGAQITLPDGTVVTGDGVSIITLPPGTYSLPSGTKIIGNPVADPEGNPGDTQANPEVTDDSTQDAKDLVRDAITQPSPVPTPNPEPSPQPDSDTEPVNPNPSDTGDGTTPVANIPSSSASAMYSVYNPSLSEINSLGAWLWSSNFIDQLLKMFNDPMQAIIGLHKTYITPPVSGRGDIKVGYLNSGVQANLVPTQYSTMDCGSVNLPEYFGNVFDYAPYTRVYIYLPFIGFKELDVSQVMRSRIGVKYRGDAYTGTGLAEVTVTRDSGAGGVLYTYGCECAVRYPLSQGSYMGFASAVAGLAVGIASGNVAPALLGFSHGSSRPAVEHSGSFSGNSGAMGIKKPYLVVMRPQPAMADRYQHYTGKPSNSLVTIGSASGLIRVKECHVDSINYATDEEKAMIETALKTGVIVS